jgi:rhodanese-related sulfurtransferase
VLAEACARRDRLGAGEAFDALRAGAVLVDIRPQINRDLEGGLPGAVVIERNVLDWRLDPASDARLPIAGYDLHINRVCNEGYASSLAAAALQNLGHTPCHRPRRCLRPGAPPAYHHRTRRTHRHATHSPEKQITTGVTPGLARRAIGLKHHDILARPRRGIPASTTAASAVIPA